MFAKAREKKEAAKPQSAFAKLLAETDALRIPKEGDVVKGRVITATKNEVRVEIEGYRTGIVRGKELRESGDEYARLAPGEAVEATVVDLENENGDVELSFRHAGALRAWEKLRELMKSGATIPVKILDANKGGITVNLHNIAGFMPVSQLSPENYPRVAGGDKQKILERLRSFVNKTMNVKVIDVNEAEEKLIVSEQAVWEEEQRGLLSSYKVGDVVEGDITAVTDFGVFVKFAGKVDGSGEAVPLEGLVHISEIAWQRIDHPKDILKIGDTAKAKIIGIEGSKIFLSMKALILDPWKDVTKKYQVGQMVRGTILKENPFGFFVELDPDIHGLAHISELADKPVRNILEIAKPGDTLEWKIVSIEPEQHRLGLSLKALKEKLAPDEQKTEEAKNESAPEVKEEK